MNEDEKNILFLDIETVGCVADYAQLDDRLKKQWARKASFLKREETDTEASLFAERAGIYAEFGKIVVIAFGMFYVNDRGETALRLKALADDDEKKLLQDFTGIMNKLDNNIRLCAHNGKEFDFPYLCRRMLVQSVTLPTALDISGKKPWEVAHLDTMHMWRFGDYKHYTSLDLLASIFNIPSSKSSMDGSMVNDEYYKQNNLSAIKQYCRDDVVVLAQLYRRLKGLPLLEQGNIVQA